MTDQIYGLGAIPSPYDPHDYPIEALYAALNIAIPDVAALPAVYASTPVPPITNQGTTPQCVAYSFGGVKDFQDYDDQAPKWWDFDEGLFFTRIGGNANGAMLRDACDQLLKVGYPVVGNAAAASQHKIAAYYAVPVTVADIKAAIATFGEVVFGVTWPWSWSNPNAAGVLPPFDSQRGGHAIRCRGWDDSKGFRWPNSWGTGFGVNGECYLPYDQLSHVFEVWKASDQPVPMTVPHKIIYAAGTRTLRVLVPNSSGACWASYVDHTGSGPASYALCSTSYKFPRCSDGAPTTVVNILSGPYKGKIAHTSGPGISYV